jgi:choline dehydrogenase-like flavoprotein
MNRAISTARKYDAIVVGSGATGGFAAKELAERGLETLVLEAGPALDEVLFHKGAGMKAIGSISRVRAAIMGQHIQARASFFSPDKRFLFVNDWKNPYTCPPDDFYLWIRGRNVGGRFLSWGRVALRMSDYDFKAASRDGIGEDWPICYDDLAPHYERVERFLGIVGTADGIPNLPDGKYVGRAGLGRVETRFKQAVESRWPARKVVPWRYVAAQATPADATGAKRTTSPLAAAAKTGRMELRANAIVRQIIIDPASGKATGVSYVDAVTKQLRSVSANVVVICASTIESVRLLLNSACAKHPNGVGNSSGLLGRYFMDQIPCLVFGSVPGSDGFELVDGTSPADNHGGMYIPRFQNLERRDYPAFARGFNIQGIAGRAPVGAGQPALFGFMGQGEMLPYYENRVSVSASKKDAWGIPVPHIELSMRDNERNMLRCQLDAIKEMVTAAGWSMDFAASLLGLDDPHNVLPNATWFERFMFRRSFRKSMALGAAIHECGGARMGEDPAKSVLNSYNQCWDAKNVFVTDSSCFVTNGTCGPTLTTMALTMRACEYIAQEYGKTSELSSAA